MFLVYFRFQPFQELRQIGCEIKFEYNSLMLGRK